MRVAWREWLRAQVGELGRPVEGLSYGGGSVAAAAAAPVAVPVREMVTRDDDTGWRTALAPRATVGTEHDLTDWQSLLREAYQAYRTNALAYAVIEQSVNFVLGGGARVVAADRRVQRVLDAFWGDPENRMDSRVYSLQTELCLFGEQFIRYFVDPLTGRTVIRQWDPLYVTAIETDPEDVEKPLRYLYQPPRALGEVGPGVAGTEALGGTWVAASEISHFAINKVSNALRGCSDLAPLLPWLRRYRDWLTDRVRQNRYKGAFVWDVTIDDADKAELDRIRAEYAAAPVEPGAVLFHNQRERWAAVQPQIGAGDVRDDGRALRLLIAAGAGLPEHYLAEGGTANRATAAEMGLPTMKRMQRRQEYFRQVLETICGRVVEEGVRAGRIGPRTRRELAVQFEELSPATLDQQALAAKAFADALALAQAQGWADPEQARRLWWRFAGDPEEATRQLELGTAGVSGERRLPVRLVRPLAGAEGAERAAGGVVEA